MKLSINVYDFDQTIYRSDSSKDFYLYNLKKDFAIVRFIPQQLYAALLYKVGLLTKTEMKTRVYVYFRAITDMDKRVQAFWRDHEHKVEAFYLKQKREDDVIISASPEFMLKPICDQLGVHLIASIVDPKTGHSQENCYGKEKVLRFKALYRDTQIHEFYSDSLSDSPLANLASKAYLVTQSKLKAWPF